MWRNILLCIVLCVGVIAGWYYLVTNYGQPDPETIAKNKEKEKPPPKKKPVEKKEDDKKPEQPPEKPKEEVAKAAPVQNDVLGGDGFHLRVKTISRGAGVRSVTLNRFKAANWLGQPTDRDLELIQDDEFAPSFRMYHYLGADDKEPPVLGLGEKNWTVAKAKTRGKDDQGEFDEIVYTTTVPDIEHIKITKTYRLRPKDYHVTLVLEFDDLRPEKDAKVVPFRYQLTGAQGLPVEGEWYAATFRHALMALVETPNGRVDRALEESAGISPRKGGNRFPLQRGNNLLQYAGVSNQYFGAVIVVDNKQPKADKILSWARPTLETTEVKGLIRKIHDDAVILRVVGGKDDAKELRFHLLPRTKQHLKDLELQVGDRCVLSYYQTPAPDSKLIATWARLGETLKPQFDDITVRVNSELIEMLPLEKPKHEFLLYHGPVKAALLGQFSGEKEVPAELVARYVDDLHLNTLTDYRSDNWFGRVSSFIYLTDLIILFTRLMHWLLYVLQSIFGSYGLSIMVLTVIVRGAMYPISRKQALFSIKMQELAPELKKIADRYPDDPQARMQATAEFNRKHGINPLASCWPLLLQMPIFLGLYFALQESIHFRLASFLWIDNLAAPDMLFYWTESIPIISQPDSSSGFLGFLYLGPYFNILPVFAVAFMLIQQIQTMPPPTDEQQATQQKMIKFMSVIFGVMFYKVAAGLCIYFITSSLWGMTERMLLPKKKSGAAGVDASGAAPLGGTPAPIQDPKGKGKWAKKEKDKVAKAAAKAAADEPVTTLGKLKALWYEILKQAEKK